MKCHHCGAEIAAGENLCACGQPASSPDPDRSSAAGFQVGPADGVDSFLDIALFTSASEEGLDVSDDLARSLTGRRKQEDHAFSVDLYEVGVQKKNVILAMCEFGGYTFEIASRLLDGLPARICTAKNLLEANGIKQQFRKWGAGVKVSPLATKEYDKTTYSLEIAIVGPRLIEVIALVREITGCDLKRARALTSSGDLASGLTEARAKRIAALFEEIGATVNTRKE